MKRIIALLIITVLCFAMLTSCDAIDTVKGWFGGEQSETSVDLDRAATNLNNICKELNTQPTKNFDVVGQIIIDGVKLPVTWVSNNESVVIEPSTKNGFYTVKLPEVNATEAQFVLTATISDGNGNSVEKSYTFTLPVYDNTAVVGDLAEGQAYSLGIYQASEQKNYYIIGQMSGYYMATTDNVNDSVNVYVEVVDGGYQMYCIYWGEKLYVNMVISDTGYVNPSFDTEAKCVYTYDSDLKTLVCDINNGLYAFGVKTAAKDDGTYYTTLGPVLVANAGDYYIVTFAESTIPDQADHGLRTPEAIINAAFALAEDESLPGTHTLTGIIKSIDDAYSSQYKNVTVTIVVEGFENNPIKCYRMKGTNADQLGVGDEITVTGIIKNYKGTVEFDAGCTFTNWVDNEDNSGDNGNTPSEPETPAHTAPVVGTAYKLVIAQNGLGKNLYFGGSTESASVTYRLAMIEAVADAVDVYVEAVDGVEGAYKLYFVVDNVKTYIEVSEYQDNDNDPGYGKGTLKLVESTELYYTFDATAGTLIYTDAEGEDSYYLGTYGTFTTASVSNASYISGDKASSVDVSQFPARLVVVDAEGGDNEGGNENEGGNTPSEPETPAHTAPVVGTAYKLVIAQNGLGKNLYFGGSTESASVTYRLAMIEAVADAVDVYVEAVDGVEGAYKLYFVVDNVKTYIEVSEYQDNDNDPGYGKGTLKLVESTELYYTFDATAGTLIYTDAEGEDSYYLGTYGTFTTASVSNASYISGDKASSVDVSQFPARLVVVDAEGGEDVGGGEAPEVCEHADENGDYKCDSCSEKLLPAADSVLTIKQALALGALYTSSNYSSTYTTEKYYIVGTIDEVYNSANGNMYLVDAEGNKITVYGTYSADGEIGYADLEVKPVKGDVIKVYGVIGAYRYDIQLGSGWIVEHTAHTHDWQDATCEEPSTCSVCGGIQGEKLGHNYGDDNVCDNCNQTKRTGTVSFNFGDNGNAAHVDGSDIGENATYESDGVALKLTGMSKVYGPAYDATGNSCLKLGTGSKVGTLTFTVGDEVQSVVIYIAGYKAATSTNLTINNTEYTVTKASNNGEYDAITIDTTKVKTITLTTVTYRCMINGIDFYYGE